MAASMLCKLRNGLGSRAAAEPDMAMIARVIRNPAAASRALPVHILAAPSRAKVQIRRMIRRPGLKGGTGYRRPLTNLQSTFPKFYRSADARAVRGLRQ
jgi:hypothetical protein